MYYYFINNAATNENQMTNFNKQLNEAISTYSELSGKTIESIKNECVDFESTTSNIIKMIMFSAR